MNGFLIETHLHTSESSLCGQSSGAEEARRYKELGYSAILVTDHFINGNTVIDTGRPWKEQIDTFMAGYDAALEEGQKIGLEVWFGLESNFSGTEFIVTGIDREWLYAHPQMATWSVEEQFAAVDAAGGLVIHAHPFREASYIPGIRLYPEHCHAVETWNMGNIGRGEGFNERAAAYAIEKGLPATGGSDAHHVNAHHGGMRFDEAIPTLEDFIARVKSGRGWTVLEKPLGR